MTKKQHRAFVSKKRNLMKQICKLPKRLWHADTNVWTVEQEVRSYCSKCTHKICEVCPGCGDIWSICECGILKKREWEILDIIEEKIFTPKKEKDDDLIACSGDEDSLILLKERLNELFKNIYGDRHLSS